jgi:murein DD-endopeptidase MepM/ murein hydrolase activator NlpD
MLQNPLKNYVISSPYGNRMFQGRTQFHNGIDLAAPIGTPVLCPEDGEVIAAWTDALNGNALRIIHNSSMITVYAHLQGYTVAKGQKVSQGDLIGYVGNTGYSFGAHLHFGVMVVKKTNPEEYEFINPEDIFKLR